MIRRDESIAHPPGRHDGSSRSVAVTRPVSALQRTAHGPIGVVLACVVSVALGWNASPVRAGGDHIRPPAVAGQFYPADSTVLARAVDCYFEDAIIPLAERPIALIAPHAGYIYSGQIAADAFCQASSFDYDVIVLLGTNHTVPRFSGVSVYAEGAFRTPLGDVPVARDLAARLLATDKDVTFIESVHAREHSIEVLLPFVQRLFPHVPILPAVIGEPDLALCTRFGEALAASLAGRRPLIVASSDLSHYPDYEDARRIDRETIRAILTLDADSIHQTLGRLVRRNVANLVTCACGEAPIMVAAVAARHLGAHGARLISRANSGETALADRTRVVGYAAIAIVRDSLADNGITIAESGLTPADTPVLTPEGKRTLLRFARKTIRQFLETETAPLARGDDPDLLRGAGVFVTLKERGELRGCIGHMAADLPLEQAVGYCALQAAFNDRRFPPLEPEELPQAQIEISILTPYRPVSSYEDIQVGRDGVLLEKDGRSAVFLPQVATEQGWDRDQMLEQLCAKAGLPRDAWRTGARFQTFQAKVFSESDFDR
ncbi:MAG: AmmeMemoRadiSam system protein B [Candidatus Zixiibacteriota bacterium]